MSIVDEPLASLIQPLRSGSADAVMKQVTQLGRGEGLVGLVLLCVLCARSRGDAAGARFLIAAGIASALLTFGLKLLFERERPDEALRLVAAGGFSFPSGHSLGSAAVFGAVASWLGRRSPSTGGALRLGVYVLVGAVGLSRAYLWVHYPSDVLAGWGLGALCVWWSSAWAYSR